MIIEMSWKNTLLWRGLFDWLISNFPEIVIKTWSAKYVIAKFWLILEKWISPVYFCKRTLKTKELVIWEDSLYLIGMGFIDEILHSYFFTSSSSNLYKTIYPVKTGSGLRDEMNFVCFFRVVLPNITTILVLLDNYRRLMGSSHV